MKLRSKGTVPRLLTTKTRAPSLEKASERGRTPTGISARRVPAAASITATESLSRLTVHTSLGSVGWTATADTWECWAVAAEAATSRKAKASRRFEWLMDLGVVRGGGKAGPGRRA